jgi:hypothetical protein
MTAAGRSSPLPLSHSASKRGVTDGANPAQERADPASPCPDLSSPCTDLVVGGLFVVARGRGAAGSRGDAAAPSSAPVGSAHFGRAMWR